MARSLEVPQILSARRTIQIHLLSYITPASEVDTKANHNYKYRILLGYKSYFAMRQLVRQLAVRWPEVCCYTVPSIQRSIRPPHISISIPYSEYLLAPSLDRQAAVQS